MEAGCGSRAHPRYSSSKAIGEGTARPLNLGHIRRGQAVPSPFLRCCRDQRISILCEPPIMNVRLANVLLSLAIGAINGVALGADSETAHLQVKFNELLGPMEMDRMALGQGGLSDQPMWADRAAEIQALHSKVIRLFVQEYFNLLPEQGRFQFEALDRSVDTIL